MKHTVTIRTVYLQEVDIEADDEDEARRLAYNAFYPDSAYIHSMDIYGLSPWDEGNPLEDVLHDQYVQARLDGD